MYSICYFREETTIARSCVQPEHDNNNCHNCHLRTTSGLRTTPTVWATPTVWTTTALWATPALRGTTKGVSKRKERGWKSERNRTLSLYDRLICKQHLFFTVLCNFVSSSKVVFVIIYRYLNPSALKKWNLLYEWKLFFEYSFYIMYLFLPTKNMFTNFFFLSFFVLFEKICSVMSKRNWECVIGL